jgi:uncharacterized protein (DUF362 family)
VVDGLYGLEGRGYVSGKPARMDLIIAGRDIVAVDSVSSAIMGYNPSKINYITLVSLLRTLCEGSSRPLTDMLNSILKHLPKSIQSSIKSSVWILGLTNLKITMQLN